MRAFIAALLFSLLAVLARADDKAVTNSIGMKLVRIEPGQFIMGQGDAPPRTRDDWDARDWDESPAHPVKISRPFYMGTTEVTNAQYERFDPEHAKLRGKFGAGKEASDPVTHVSWEQAMAFCAWLSKQEGKPYRLPTEAEWEYACRAGSKTLYHTGDQLSAEQANLGMAADGKKKLALVPVGSYAANAWGLHDLHGNVAEWCLDWFGPYEAGEQTDPVGRSQGEARVVRGWSYLSPGHKLGAARYARSANRSAHLPDDANRLTGFRVVQAEMPATKPLPPASLPPHQQDVKQTPSARTHPDPATPYFVNFNMTDKALAMPSNLWGPIFSAHNHFTAICVCPNGDVLAVWYSTVSEAGRECAQAASRLRADTGKWDTPAHFFSVADCNTHAPVLLSDGKRLYHFFTQSFNGWDDAAEGMRTSDDNGATWSPPRIILPREHARRMSQPCSAFVAKNGKLVLAVDGDNGHRDERVMTSTDRGQTWQVAAGDMRQTVGKYAIHPAIVPRDDGAILSFLRGPDPMPMLVSRDEGESWQMGVTPFPGISVGQKAAALRLASGALLLCSFDNKKQLGLGGTFAALSLDEGKTWPHVRKVEGPGGYMSVAQGANGVIYLFGSRERCVAFNEAWLKAR